MKTWWEKKKSFVVGLAAGALLLWAGGFALLGWYWPGTVQSEKVTAYQVGQTSAFAQVCAAQFQFVATPEQTAEVSKSTYGRGDAILKVVIAIPGVDKIDAATAAKCGDIVADAAAKKQAAK